MLLQIEAALPSNNRMPFASFRYFWYTFCCKYISGVHLHRLWCERLRCLMCLVNIQRLADVRIQMKIYFAVRLFNDLPNETLNKMMFYSDFEISLVFLKKLIKKIFCRRCMLHVVDKYLVHNEFLSITLHEYRLLTIYSAAARISCPVRQSSAGG